VGNSNAAYSARSALKRGREIIAILITGPASYNRARGLVSRTQQRPPSVSKSGSESESEMKLIRELFFPRIALRDAGCAELEEVTVLADRLLIIREGRIVGEVDPKRATTEEIGLIDDGWEITGQC